MAARALIDTNVLVYRYDDRFRKNSGLPRMSFETAS